MGTNLRRRALSRSQKVKFLSCCSCAVSHVSRKTQTQSHELLKECHNSCSVVVCCVTSQLLSGQCFSYCSRHCNQTLARSSLKEEGFILGQNSGNEFIVVSQAWRQRKQVTSHGQSGNTVGPEMQARYNLWGLLPSPHCPYLLIVSHLHKTVPQAGEQLFKQRSPCGTSHIRNMVNGIL